jgi:hypothetical protein
MLSFRTLWDNHPTTKGDDHPCKSTNGLPNFPNQCAIRLGVALKESGMNLQSYRGARCWFGHKHLIRVEELAKWLEGQVHQVGTVKVYKPGSVAKEELNGETGIVACLNFWGPGNQGDHIDLWDGSNLRKGSSDYFDDAEKVLFWGII